MITAREETILRIIVDEYTRTAQPVGSKKIMELMGNEISSATIRSECAILENHDFLEKPHTSSGRIPSTKGYRYYVDNLMNESPFDGSLFQQIDELFSNRDYSIDQIIMRSSQIISDMTNLVAVISQRDEVDDLKIKKIELIPLNDGAASVIFILSSGQVISKVFYLDYQVLNDLKIAINLFNDNLTETKVKHLSKAVVDDVGSNLKTSIKDYEAFFSQFINAILEQSRIKTQTVGLNNVLVNPEFMDVEKIKNIMTIIANVSPFEWFDYNYQSSKKNVHVRTKIGLEINPNLKETDDIAIIGAEIDGQGSQKNIITLIGPKRMRYDEANLLLNFLIKKINGLQGND